MILADTSSLLLWVLAFSIVSDGPTQVHRAQGLRVRGRHLPHRVRRAPTHRARRQGLVHADDGLTHAAERDPTTQAARGVRQHRGGRHWQAGRAERREQTERY